MDLKSTAESNRDYYLAEQRAEEGRESWYRYVKTLETYSEPVLITPEMAQEALAGFELTRPISVSIFWDRKEYPTVSISFSGMMLDGQHVLEAIRTGEATIVFVQFNISDKLTFMFD